MSQNLSLFGLRTFTFFLLLPKDLRETQKVLASTSALKGVLNRGN